MVKLATRSRDVNVATARCAHAHIIVKEIEKLVGRVRVLPQPPRAS